jgi:hypothetical protein
MSITCVVIGSFSAIVVVAFAVWMAKHVLASYFDEKGKNLATKEDIAEITHKIEAVRLQYTDITEALKARHQLRLAAIDKRLQAHQEAFTHWRRLTWVKKEELVDALMAGQSWWEQHCLYLEPDVRRALMQSLAAAKIRADLLEMCADSKHIEDAFQKMMAFGEILTNAIKLPKLAQLELESIDATTEKQKKAWGY